MRRVLMATVMTVIMTLLLTFIISGSDEPAVHTDPEISMPAPTKEEKIFISFSDYIRHTFDSLETVGAAYTIVYDNRVAATETLGKRILDTEEPVDEHTVFRLASVSKGFAGTMAAMLEDKGLLKLDDHVIDYYPGLRLKDSVNTYGLTIQHVLSHTTGLIPHAYDNLVEAGYDLDSIIKRLQDVDISAPPGEVYSYQNVLFSIIDPISEKLTGLTYPELLRQEIFLPLGMSDASAGKIDTTVNPNIAFPHLKGRSSYFPVNLNEGYYNVLPAAGVNASISDMAKWLLALLGGNETFRTDMLEKLCTPVIYTPLKWQYTRHWEPFRERYYSLGWRIYDYKGRRILYHGGYVRGYRAEIAFCPEEQVGIAFLQNSPNGMASRVVPEFFNRFFERSQANL